MTTETHVRDITPHPSLLPKSGQVNYTIPDAVGELVDNEVDARIAGQLLSIDIYIGQREGGTIQVKGDGAGMDVDTLAAAMRMGFSTKAGTSIGQFGVGMKTACTNLGRRFEIVTARADMDRGARVDFDEQQFLEADRWEIEIEEIDKPFPHGTAITITDPKVSIYGGVNDTIALYMARTLRHFINAEQVAILVNGVPVMPFHWDLEEGPEPFEFDVNGKTVRGWKGLQRKFSPKSGYGLDLIRHNRVVKRHDKTGFYTHPQLNRIVGEVHLDEFEVVNNKTDFMRDTDDWRAFEECMKEEMRPLVQLSFRRYRGKLAASDEAIVAGLTDKVESAIRSEEFARSLDHRLLADAIQGELTPVQVERRHRREGGGDGPTSEEIEGELDGGTKRPRTPKETREVLRRTRTKLLHLNIEHIPVKFGPESPYKTWDEDGLGERRRLVVSSNLDHPMFSAVGDTVTWIKHNIAEAAAEFLSKETGLIEDMLKIKSDVLRYVGELEIAEEQQAQQAMAS